MINSKLYLLRYHRDHRYVLTPFTLISVMHYNDVDVSPTLLMAKAQLNRTIRNVRKKEVDDASGQTEPYSSRLTKILGSLGHPILSDWGITSGGSENLSHQQ